MAVQDIFSGVRSSLAIKAPCKALSTTNLVLSGEQTINGVACIDGDRVIPNGQTDAREGGIWVVSTGLWSRASDADGNNDFAKGTMVRVNFGTNAGIYALTNSDPVVIGTTGLSFQLTLDSSSIEFIQAGTGSVTRSVASKLGDDVTVWDKIPEAQKAAILDGTSTYDAAPSLDIVAAERRLDIPEGRFRIDSTINVARGIQGRSAKYSIIAPSANTFDAVSLTDTAADFQHVSDLTVAYASVGTGRGIVLENINNNVEVNRCNVQHGVRGFSTDLVAFMQRFQQCRADFCTTGFYAQGLNGGGGGAGTTLIYDQCYVSNGTGSTVGWSLNNIRSVEMIQPTLDMGGVTTGIQTVGVGQLNIFGHHFEGTPPGTGSYINYSTSGSLANGICVVGGSIEIANLSALTFSYLNVQANDDHVRIVLQGVNVRNLTGGTNARLATLAGAAGSRIEIIAINCNFGALEGVFNTTNMLGTWSYRRIDQENLPSSGFSGVYDDFMGITLNGDIWRGRVGTDPQCVTPTIRADQRTGVVRLVGGDDGAGSMATNGVQMESALNYRAQDGSLLFEARVVIGSAVSNICLFLGLTDQNSALEMPFTLAAGDALTSNATDAVGVLFDTAADTDQWCLVGVKADVDATKQFTGFVPVNTTYEIWRIDVTQQGNASFYRNGVLVGTAMSNAITASVLLTPVVAAFSRGAAVRNVDVDFIKCQQIR